MFPSVPISPFLRGITDRMLSLSPERLDREGPKNIQP